MKKIITLLLILSSLFSYSQSTTLVISQLYGAGGNANAIYNADYVELHNISASPISLSGYSIQYASAVSVTTWSGVSALPAVSIPAGGYYLIQMSTVGVVGAALPTPDNVASPNIAMSATNGKVALVNGIVALAACNDPSIVDLVGYGPTANCSEGGVPTPVLSALLAAIRNNNGCDETNNNGNDFTAATPAPRNGASPVVLCGGGPPVPTLTVTGAIADFGNIVVGANSASQSFNLSGANLTGAPGTITITAPSTDFQVSNDNATWGASTTKAYATATLASTPVYIRFTPQTAGLKTGNITITGGGVATAVTVAVSGTGVLVATPSLNASALTAFGSVCISTTAGPNSFTLTGANLTPVDIMVGPLAGYTFSTTAGGTYTASLDLTQPGGSYSQTVFVDFTPITATSYNGNIPVSGGGATAFNVAASGSGGNAGPTVTTGIATAITTNSATAAGSITATGCSAVTAYGIEFSTTNNFPVGTGTQVASTNLAGGNFSSNLTLLAPSTTYYFRAYATNTGGTAYGVQHSFITASPSMTATALSGFATVCANTTAGPNSFTITGVSLTTADVLVGPKNGYSFSTTIGGTYTASLTLTQPGGAFSQLVYVNFTPTTTGSYNGNIPVTGGGAPNLNVAVTGSGVNTVGTVSTSTSTVLTPYMATASGNVSDIGCSVPTEVGIEYSSVINFTGGYGTKVPADNISGADFSSTLTGLIQNTTYYYKAYVTNNGGTAYGDEESFITSLIPVDFTIYSTPITRGGNIHYSITNMIPGHYSAKVYNIVGQLVFQHDLILQVNFIDDNFIIPAQLGPGVYTLQIENTAGFKAKKSFMIR